MIESALSIPRSEIVNIRFDRRTCSRAEETLIDGKVISRLQSTGRRIQPAEMNDGKHTKQAAIHLYFNLLSQQASSK